MLVRVGVGGVRATDDGDWIHHGVGWRRSLRCVLQYQRLLFQYIIPADILLFSQRPVRTEYLPNLPMVHFNEVHDSYILDNLVLLAANDLLICEVLSSSSNKPHAPCPDCPFSYLAISTGRSAGSRICQTRVLGSNSFINVRYEVS